MLYQWGLRSQEAKLAGIAEERDRGDCVVRQWGFILDISKRESVFLLATIQELLTTPLSSLEMF